MGPDAPGSPHTGPAAPTAGKPPLWPLLTRALLPYRDLNHNELHQFPVAIRTLGRLQEL